MLFGFSLTPGVTWLNLFVLATIAGIATLLYFVFVLIRELKPLLVELKGFQSTMNYVRREVLPLISILHSLVANVNSRLVEIQEMIETAKEMAHETISLVRGFRDLDTGPARRAIAYVKQQIHRKRGIRWKWEHLRTGLKQKFRMKKEKSHNYNQTLIFLCGAALGGIMAWIRTRRKPVGAIRKNLPILPQEKPYKTSGFDLRAPQKKPKLDELDAVQPQDAVAEETVGD